jgi:2-polyprenyl-3-methyl-5-hydroxy-6-metoxy-1,4-benzoquinol methylase
MGVMARLLRKLRRALFDADSSFCDMYEDAHARAAAEEYLVHIRRHLHERFGKQRLTIVDAGCQAGRLLIPLAQDGHRLIGIDASGFALRRARRHAQALGLSVELRRGDIGRLRRWVAPSGLDAVVCTEVLYLCEEYRTLLRLLADSVKPGGLLFVSHRPSLYYMACALRQGEFEQASSLMRRTEGPSPHSGYHNWQTQEQLGELYREANARVLDCYPVDYEEVQLNLAQPLDPEVKRLLDSADHTDSTFRIPSYFFVVAQKTRDMR